MRVKIHPGLVIWSVSLMEQCQGKVCIVDSEAPKAGSEQSCLREEQDHWKGFFFLSKVNIQYMVSKGKQPRRKGGIKDTGGKNQL